MFRGASSHGCRDTSLENIQQILAGTDEQGHKTQERWLADLFGYQAGQTHPTITFLRQQNTTSIIPALMKQLRERKHSLIHKIRVSRLIEELTKNQQDTTRTAAQNSLVSMFTTSPREYSLLRACLQSAFVDRYRGDLYGDPELIRITNVLLAETCPGTAAQRDRILSSVFPLITAFKRQVFVKEYLDRKLEYSSQMLILGQWLSRQDANSMAQAALSQTEIDYDTIAIVAPSLSRDMLEQTLTRVHETTPLDSTTISGGSLRALFKLKRASGQPTDEMLSSIHVNLEKLLRIDCVVTLEGIADLMPLARDPKTITKIQISLIERLLTLLDNHTNTDDITESVRLKSQVDSICTTFVQCKDSLNKTLARSLFTILIEGQNDRPLYDDVLLRLTPICPPEYSARSVEQLIEHITANLNQLASPDHASTTVDVDQLATEISWLPSLCPDGDSSMAKRMIDILSTVNHPPGPSVAAFESILHLTPHLDQASLSEFASIKAASTDANILMKERLFQFFSGNCLRVHQLEQCSEREAKAAINIRKMRV